MTSPRNKWTPQQIRTARRVPLKPLLEQLGYRLDPLKNENWKVYGLPQTEANAQIISEGNRAEPGSIVVKEHYWSCPEDGTGGNAIDLLVQVLDMGFNEAMSLLQRFG